MLFNPSSAAGEGEGAPDGPEAEDPYEEYERAFTPRPPSGRQKGRRRSGGKGRKARSFRVTNTEID